MAGISGEPIDKLSTSHESKKNAGRETEAEKTEETYASASQTSPRRSVYL